MLRRSDIAKVVLGWNSCLLYDRISEEKFENTVFDDPNYEKVGNVVAVENQGVIGFVAAVAREGIVGRDGAGTVEEKDFGYIKGLFVLNEYRESGIRSVLLNQALEHLRSKGKKIAKVGQYTGSYFSPGIDIRYEEDLEFFRKSGFREVDAEEDVKIDLEFFKPTDYQNQAMRRAANSGVIIKSYQTRFLDKMRDFARRLNYPQWFPEGWESSFQKKDHYHLVAMRESEIVGWVRFFKEPESWWFGPIAVLEDLRRKGIGTCLLLESMLQMKKLGAHRVTAGWANVPFYFRNGWKTSRRYVVLQKILI